MAYRSAPVVTPIRAWVLGALALSALLVRVPWSRLGVDVEIAMLAGTTPWSLTGAALGATVSVLIEFALIWALVFFSLPELYPSRARQLTASLPFRAVVSGLTTAVSVTLFFVITRQLSPAALLVLVATTLVVTVLVTSSTDRWSFATPYVSPAFAVLASFVPTSRIGEFADLFRTGTTDLRTRVVCQALLGVVTTGVVLVIGAVAALSTLASPALELLTLGGLFVVFGRRLFPALPTRWRLRVERAARKGRAQLWAIRRLLTDPRGSAATLLVTAGLLLGTSAGALAVAVAASAARRTVTFSTRSLSPTGVFAEWFVAGALVGYAATVVWFWWRSARWLPAFIAADKARRGGPLRTAHLPRVDRPSGVLVPQSLLLIAALFALYPGALPGSNPGPALVVVCVTLVWSLAIPVSDHSTTARRGLHARVPERLASSLPVGSVSELLTHESISMFREHDALSAGRERLSNVLGLEAEPNATWRDWVALPLAFSVQWVGTSAALVVLPGTEATSVWPMALVFLLFVLGGYFYVDLRDRMANRGIVGFDVVSLLVLTVVVGVLVWLANGVTLASVFG